MLERIVEAKNNIEYVINESMSKFDYAARSIKDYVDSIVSFAYSSSTINNPSFSMSDSTYPLSAAVMTWDGQRHYSGNDLEEISARDNELDKVYSEFEEYWKKYGSSLMEYLDSKGMKPVDIVGIASADLGDGVVAAIQRTNKEGLLIANKNYHNTITAFAYAHGLTYDEARKFVWDHEIYHATGIDSEREVFENQFKNYTKMVLESEGDERDSYIRLASAARSRYLREENGKEEAE